MSMPFLPNFWQWPATAVHKKTLGAVLFRNEFKSLRELLQHRTRWPARSEVGRPMRVRVSALVPSRVDPLMGRNPLSTDSRRLVDGHECRLSGTPTTEVRRLDEVTLAAFSCAEAPCRPATPHRSQTPELTILRV